MSRSTPRWRRVAAIGLAALLLCAVGAPRQSRAAPPRQMLQGEAQAAEALQAALTALNGAPSSECGDNGQMPPPGKDTCVALVGDQTANAERGLVSVQSFVSAGVQPRLALIGIQADGSWGLWFAAPAAYVPTQLPAEARICAGGDGLNLRAGPSLQAEILAVLPDETVLPVDQFRLSRPGTWSRTGADTIGQGWYRALAPYDGWVAAQYVVVAEAGCELALPE